MGPALFPFRDGGDKEVPKAGVFCFNTQSL